MPIIAIIDQINNTANFDSYVNDQLVSFFRLDVVNSIVSASALENDTSLSFSDYKNNIYAIKRWIEEVDNIFLLDQTKPKRTKQNYIKHVNGSEGNFKIMDYSYDVEYKKNDDLIIAKARLENNFTWKEFVFFTIFHNKFILEIGSSY